MRHASIAPVLCLLLSASATVAQTTPAVAKFEIQTEAARCAAIAAETVCFAYDMPSEAGPGTITPPPATVKVTGLTGVITAEAIAVSPAARPWLRAADAAAAGIELSVDADVLRSLKAGRYLAYLRITGGGLAAPAKLPVQLTIGGASPLIAVEPESFAGLAFTLDPRNPPIPLTSFVSVRNLTESETPLTVSVTPETSDGGMWLSADLSVAAEAACIDSPAPCGFQITITPPSQPGQYWGVIAVGGEDFADRIAVSLTVTGPPPAAPAYYSDPRLVSLSAAAGSRLLSSTNVALKGGVDGTPFLAFRSDSWLNVSAAGPVWPSTLSVSVDPTGLDPGTYTDTIFLRHAVTSELLASIPVTFNVVAPLYLSTLMDGGGWSSAIHLVNPGPKEARFRLDFWSDAGPWNLALADRARDSKVGWETIPAFGMRVIETIGEQSATKQGWAELTSDGAVSGFAVLRQRKQAGAKHPPVEAVLPLLNSFRDRFVIPYDQTNDGLNAIAISNAEDEPVTIQVRVRNESGVEMALEKPIVLGAHGYTAFALPDRFASTIGRRGLVDFWGEGGPLFGIGVRFTANGGFVAYPGFPNGETGLDRGVPHFAFGGEWQSTVNLMNSAPVAHAGNLRFFQRESGSQLAVPLAGDTLRHAEIARPIPANGMLEVATNGSQKTTDIGWMETTYLRPVSGYVLMRRNFEGMAAPSADLFESSVNADRGMHGKLAVQFDNRAGYDTKVVLVNTADTPTEIQTVIYDAQGRYPRYADSFRLAAKGQLCLKVADRWESLAGQQGILEFFSRSSNRLAGAALRSSDGPMTVLPAYEK